MRYSIITVTALVLVTSCSDEPAPTESLLATAGAQTAKLVQAALEARTSDELVMQIVSLAAPARRSAVEQFLRAGLEEGHFMRAPGQPALQLALDSLLSISARERARR
jgi:hypothetical protein